MAESNGKTATLSFGGKTLELPMMSPVSGPDVIDIRKLYAEADVFESAFQCVVNTLNKIQAL